MEVTHVPVLAEEVLQLLAPRRGGTFVDCTVGLGGHAAEILAAASSVRLIGIDRDARALDESRQRLQSFGPRVELRHGRFGELVRLVTGCGVTRVAGVLADLGLSSLQIETGERGFSFRRPGPLDMRMGNGELTAAEVVNQYPEAELTRIIREYGEDRQARRVARALVEARRERPVGSTEELRDIVYRAKGGRRREGGIDAATRVFQALRIEVNQELSELEGLLDQAVRLLDQEGRLVIISYHSLEDRLVKNRFRELSRGVPDLVTGRPRAETKVLELLTKRPIRPRRRELEANPRARSARLRAARRI